MADDQLKRIEDKVDAVIHRIGSIDVTIAKQQVSLDEHIQRTNLLQAVVQIHQDKMSEFTGAIKFVKLVGVLAAIAEAVSQVYRHYG
jgi:hypothetical protein